jgi:hypothetical protein
MCSGVLGDGSQRTAVPHQSDHKVARNGPQFASWWRSRMQEQWELESVTDEFRDYGVVEWKRRVVEAGFSSIAFQMKQRELG